MSEIKQKEWYGNKELFEMISEFKDEVSDLKTEMKETKTLIRDYNGLRENYIGVNARVGDREGNLSFYLWRW